MEPSSILRWIECHPSTAAWVQAVGTVAAIAIGFYAPLISARFSSRERQREQAIRTHNLVEMLHIPANDVGRAAALIKDIMLPHESEPPDATELKGWFDEILLKLPPQLEFLDQLTDGIDEEKISPFRKVIKSVRAFNSLRFQLGGIAETLPDEWNDMWMQTRY